MSKSKGRADVDTLLAERARFEAWLDQLLAKSSTVPTHVVERVRGDYEARLAKVVEELRTRADDLRAEAESLETKLGALDAELTARKDARAEDELRAMVGEYDEGAWAAKSAEHDDGIRRVEADRDRGQADLSRAREMLSETTRPSRAMRAIDEATIPDQLIESAAADGAEPGFTPIAEAAAIEGLPLIEPEPAKPAARPSAVPPTAPEVPTTRSPSPFDEIGFLRTVVGRATPMAGVEAPAGRPSVTDANSVATSTPPDAPVAPASPVAAPVEAAAPVAPAVSPARVSAAAAMPAGFDGPILDETVAPVPEDAEAAAKAAEAARTLKCQECGWMNFPTEWYCEKCGGELAAF